MRIQVRLLVKEQSDLDLHCLLKRLQNMLTVKTKTYNFLYMCFKGKLM